VTDSADAAISFLTANYDSDNDKIYITTIDGAKPGISEKGTYGLFLSFTEPGVYLVDLSLVLEVYDICNDSDFPDAPTFIENEYDYWIG